MSLLTNEQIEELTLVHDKWWDGNENFQKYLNEWNEKQTSVQFEPNWDDIPEEVIEVQLKVDWLRPDTGDYYEEPFFIKIYKRPLRAHPHAEIMMKYAEVAARRIDPWVEFEITFDKDYDCWSSCDVEIRFLADGRRYRHIGDRA
jgi:hypothetical protein